MNPPIVCPVDDCPGTVLYVDLFEHLDLGHSGRELAATLADVAIDGGNEVEALRIENARLRGDVAELEAATGRKKVPWVLPRHRRAFTRGASSQAIEAHLHARRTERRQLDRHIEWLEGLLADRLEQVAAGTWPATTVPLGRDVSDGGQA